MGTEASGSSDADDASDHVSADDFELRVDRTFLCYARRLLDEGTVVQSTTEAHSCCVNPRRLNPDVQF